MELRDLNMLYNYNRPLRVLLYSEKPFKVAVEAYVVDGKLIDDDGNAVCDNIDMLDYKHGYNMFTIEWHEEYLVAKVCHMVNA